MPSILLFGATGLIGSNLLPFLKSSQPKHQITLYVRNTTLDKYFTTTGADRIVHGTYDESSKISSLAAEHDVVVNVGSSWDIALTEAIIAGLKKEKDGEGKILIHMSGTANWVNTRSKDGAHHNGLKIWDDDNPSDMEQINPAMLNGGPDALILKAGNATKLKTYIMFPPVIYGYSVGPGKALGVVQYLMKAKAEELGFIPYVGAGTALVNAVHAKDVSRFVVLVLGKALEGYGSGEGENAYERCFNIGGKFLTWKAVADAFAEALFKEGLVKEAKARSVSLDEAGVGEVPQLMASDQSYSFRRGERLGFEVKEVGLIEFLLQGEGLF